MFNLEHEIGQWRRRMRDGGTIAPDELEELESHLRDEVEEQVRSGADEERAFELAVQHLGSPAELKRVFAKLPEAGASRRRTFLRYFYFIGAMTAVLIEAWTLMSFDLSWAQRLGASGVVALFASFLFGLPIWLGRRRGAPSAWFLGAFKVVAVIVPLWILLALLTALRIVHCEIGIVPQMVMWSLCAVRGFTALAFMAGFGGQGGSAGGLPPLYPVPVPIPLQRPCPPECGIPVPPASAFTPVTRKALDLAREEALRLGHDFIGTEHVLLGLLRMAGDALAQAFERSQVHADAVRTEIERLVSPLPAHTTSVSPPLTPRARRALRLAGAEAAALKQPVICPEHVFLGLLREGSGVAALALRNLGFRLKRMRVELRTTDR